MGGERSIVDRRVVSAETLGNIIRSFSVHAGVHSYTIGRECEIEGALRKRSVALIPISDEIWWCVVRRWNVLIVVWLMRVLNRRNKGWWECRRQCSCIGLPKHAQIVKLRAEFGL